MGNKLQLINDPQFGDIRIVVNDNEPMFCLADVCNIVGIANARNVKTRLDSEDVHQIDTPTQGGIQSMTFVTESGLYDVILRSDSPKAKPFRKWVTTDVLPSIRKHGGYLTPQKIEEALLNPDTIIRLATSLKEEWEKRVTAEAENNKNKPKVLFASAVAASQKSILIGELAKIICQNGVEIGQKRLFKRMREKGYLCQHGESYNQPSQRSMEQGLLEMRKVTVNKPDGTILVTTTTKVTGKGQIYFVNKFLGSKNIA